MFKLIVILTGEEIEKLEEATSGYCDEGPHGQGWQSELMESVSQKISKSIKESTLNDG